VEVEVVLSNFTSDVVVAQAEVVMESHIERFLLDDEHVEDGIETPIVFEMVLNSLGDMVDFVLCNEEVLLKRGSGCGLEIE